MIDAANIHARMISVITDYTNLLSKDISGQSRLVDDLGMGSLELVAVVTALENEFDVRIPDDIAAEMATVDELAGFIIDRLTVKLEAEKAKNART